MEIFLLFSFSFLRCYYMIDVTSCFSLVFSQMLKFWSCVRQMFHLDIWLVETVFEPAWILPCDMFVFIFIQFGIVNLYSMFVCSPSKSMRSRISFWQPEGRMPELLRSRRTRIWSSSRFAVPSTFTLCVSPTLRRLTSWNNHFLQVSSLCLLLFFPIRGIFCVLISVGNGTFSVELNCFVAFTLVGLSVQDLWRRIYAFHRVISRWRIRKNSYLCVFFAMSCPLAWLRFKLLDIGDYCTLLTVMNFNCWSRSNASCLLEFI